MTLIEKFQTLLSDHQKVKEQMVAKAFPDQEGFEWKEVGEYNSRLLQNGVEVGCVVTNLELKDGKPNGGTSFYPIFDVDLEA